ncbi:efflux RND transporter periplasmic adaptor subunit [Lysobacter hankyongensis]|uniref:Efflux RND transporter periplasmic adaptor subunit n=1 Tax=Lysobacter hankyongensis TaxID=1176535 RepID=A0ABP9AQW7_9GAMM
MKFNRKWAIAGLIVALIAVPVLIKKSRGGGATGVDLAKVEAQQVQPSILASGVLAFRNEVDLTAEVTAKVRTILVKEGDTVEQGQTLLLLDPEIYNNAIEREQASLRQSRIGIERQRDLVALRQKTYERSRVLAEQRLIDRARLDEDRNQLDLARADLRTSEESMLRAESVLNDAREQRARTEIRSPISGRVVSLPIKVGETAVPSTSAFAGAQLMKIADTTEIIAELKVDEADIAKIDIGQRAEVFAAAHPDTALKGTVEQIALAPTIEGQGRAYKVTVRLVAPDGLRLRSGMSVRSDIFLGDGQRRPAVPVEAVVTDTDEKGVSTQSVWVQRDGKATKVAVQVGVSDDRWQVIEKGVVAGDTVIAGPTKTLRLLREGEAVEQRKPEETDAGKAAGEDGDDA